MAYPSSLYNFHNFHCCCKKKLEVKKRLSNFPFTFSWRPFGIPPPRTHTHTRTLRGIVVFPFLFNLIFSLLFLFWVLCLLCLPSSASATGWVSVWPALAHPLSLPLYLSLSLSLLLSLFSGKLRLLRRLARIFKYTRVLSLPLNHIFILYLFAVPPSTCTTPDAPLFSTLLVAPICRPLASALAF